MKKLIAVILIISMTGCATYRPVVDTKGVDMNAYNNDLRECQAYAEQVNPADHAAAGAIAGAVFGALLGAAMGNRSLAGRTAGVGALSGMAGAGGEGVKAQINIVRSCMSQRGYKVLN